MIYPSYKRVTPDESDYFDILRGASALVVFIHHLFIFFWEPHIGKQVFGGILTDSSSLVAAWAVMIFFVISGFMITSSIYNNASKQQFKSFDYKKYIKDRIYRLHPPLLFSLALVLVVFFTVTSLQLHGSESYLLEGDYLQKIESIELSAGNFLANAFYLQNLDASIPFLEMNAPLWSLSFEFWYYVLALLLALSIFSRNRFWFIGLFIILLLYISTLSNAFFFACGAVVWFAGAFLALMYQSPFFHTKYVKVFFLICLLSFTLLTLYSYSADKQSIFNTARVFIAGLAMFSYLGLLLTFSLIKPTTNKRSRLYMGSAKYSYTLYIIHWPLLMLANSLFHPMFHDSIIMRIIITLASFIIIIKIAKMSAYIFEDRKKIQFIISYLSKAISFRQKPKEA